MSLSIRKITTEDQSWVLEIFRKWGADFIVSRGRIIYPAQLEGFCAFDKDGKKVGLITFEIIGDQCEMITLDAFNKFSGIGTVLVDEVKKFVQGRKCHRLWLITTNDNLDAIRFYQRRGFTFAEIHKNALDYSRQLKPSIPKIGYYGIILRDEIEMEMFLD